MAKKPEQAEENTNETSDRILAEDEIAEFSTHVEAQESPVRAMIQIVVAAVIFGGLTGLYLWNANRVHAADLLIADARPLAELADVYSLTQARDKFIEAHTTKASDKTLAGLVETNTLLWLLHGLEDFKQDALDYSLQAEDDNIERAERYAYGALIASQAGDNEKAITAISGALDRGAVSERLSWVLGRAQRATGKLKEGRDNLRRAQDSGGSPHFGVDLGDAYEEDGDGYNAKTYWAKANKENSTYVPAAARHLIGRSRNGEPLVAMQEELKRLDALDAATVGKIDLAYIQDARAEVAYREGKTKDAITAINKASELGGTSPARDFQLARAMMANGKTKEAIKLYASVQSKIPGSIKYLYQTAKAYSAAGKHGKAIKLLTTTELKADLAEKAGYHTAIGDAHHAKKDFAAADKAYQAALKISKRYPMALLGLGVNEWRKGKDEKAIEWFEKALGARSRFPEVYEALGLMLLARGAASDANTQLEQAEKGLKARGTDAVRMNGFYATVIKTLASKGGSSYVSAWVAREKQFRESGS